MPDLAISDLTLLPRYGLTGPGAAAKLRQAGFELPEGPNRYRSNAHGLLAKLSDEEFLQLDFSVLDDALEPVKADVWCDDFSQNVYSLPRSDSHALLAIVGQRAAETMAKLCAVDLASSSFVAGDVAQTSVARVSSIVMRHAFAAKDAVLLLVPSPAAEYVWFSLLDAAAEYSGSVVSSDALKSVSTV